MIERIEVIRGPAAARYGNGAAGGVVNIITKKTGDEWHGSWNTYMNAPEHKDEGSTKRTNFSLSGPLGGDLQIGARLAEGGVQAVVFLRDPMTPQPHEPDINALVRACDVHDVPCATNVSGARLLLRALSTTSA